MHYGVWLLGDPVEAKQQRKETPGGLSNRKKVLDNRDWVKTVSIIFKL